MERAFIEHGHPAERSVISCGGGLVLPPGMLTLLKSRACRMPARFGRDDSRTHRPAKNPAPAERRRPRGEDSKNFSAEREPIYRSTGSVILTDARPMADIVAHVLRVVAARCGGFRARDRGRRTKPWTRAGRNCAGA